MMEKTCQHSSNPMCSSLNLKAIQAADRCPHLKSVLCLATFDRLCTLADKVKAFKFYKKELDQLSFLKAP